MARDFIYWGRLKSGAILQFRCCQYAATAMVERPQAKMVHDGNTLIAVRAV
jgi:hypothetical protein